MMTSKTEQTYRWKNTNFFGSPPNRMEIEAFLAGQRDDIVVGKVDVSNLVTPNAQMQLPEHYQPRLSTKERLQYAYQYADMAAELGFTPVAASVVGSALRGVDQDGSDVDGLVLVAENIKAKTLEGDVSVQSLEVFLQKLSTSVPYVEFLYSPFLVADARILPFLRSQRIDRYLFEVHAERFVSHLQNRKSLKLNPEKQLRNSICAWYLKNTLSPLVPRSITSLEGAPQEALDWIESCKQLGE